MTELRWKGAQDVSTATGVKGAAGTLQPAGRGSPVSRFRIVGRGGGAGEGRRAWYADCSPLASEGIPMPHSQDHQTCIAACTECHRVCLDTLTRHCLVKGGAHAAPDHVRMMLDCAAICQTSADFMIRGSPRHGAVCQVCASICAACAESCARFDDPAMRACAEACRACAVACRRMAQEQGAG